MLRIIANIKNSSANKIIITYNKEKRIMIMKNLIILLPLKELIFLRNFEITRNNIPDPISSNENKV